MRYRIIVLAVVATFFLISPGYADDFYVDAHYGCDVTGDGTAEI